MYTYKDIKDKSSKGLTKELATGLAKIAFYMFQTYGFPKEMFEEEVLKNKNKAENWLFYMNFRNEYPQAFK